MNTRIIIDSLKYVSDNLDKVVSLSKWINEELILVNYDDSKYVRSIKKWDYEVTESIHYLNSILTRRCMLIHKPFTSNIVNIVEMYLKDSEFQKHKYCMMKLACICGCIELANLCIEVADDHSLDIACEYGHIDIVTLLINKGVNINHDEHEPFAIACCHGNLDIVKLLFGLSKNISQFAIDDALVRSSDKGYLDVVKFLVDSGANVHFETDEALKGAVVSGHADVVSFLISKGINIRTLKLAITWSEEEVLEILVKEYHRQKFVTDMIKASIVAVIGYTIGCICTKALFNYYKS